VSTIVGPARLERAPAPQEGAALSSGPRAVETRLGIEPSDGGFAIRLPRQRDARHGVLGPIRTADPRLRKTMLSPLSYEDIKCAGKDSNLRVGCLIYIQVRSPLRHRRLG
jgi:hypothetical protein